MAEHEMQSERRLKDQIYHLRQQLERLESKVLSSKTTQTATFQCTQC